MLRLQQKVKVHCTDTDVTASGVVVKIRPDGIDVALDQGDVVVRCKKSHRPFVYVGNMGGMEFVVRTDTPQLGRG